MAVPTPRRGLGAERPHRHLVAGYVLVRDSTPKNWEQTEYEIEIIRAVLEAPELWKHSVAISRTGPVRVRAYGNSSSEPTDWSPWTVIECALLNREEWKGRPITSATLSSSDAPLRPLRFRRAFTSPSEAVIVGRSRLYITSLGVYRAFLNGKPISDHCMAPGWTSYNHRLNYQVFDVAPLLKPNEANVLAVEVAEGWYAGRLGFNGGRRNFYGSEIGLLAQLEVGRENDEPFTIVAIVRSEIYDGELYDAQEECPGWNMCLSEQDNHTWHAVRELELPKAELVAPDAPPVRVIEEVNPVAFITTPSGKTVIDFGQNLVGRLLIRSLYKPRGHSVTFTHAEVLENGELGIRPLRQAQCTDTVVSSGAPLENWSPQFTFHGFRYVLVQGWSPDDLENPLLQSTSLCAQVLHTDMRRTGHFSCTHSMINQLHQNALWSMRGNFLSIPTDCPQRDERLGWTGDIQVFCPSANFLYDTAGMLGDWLKDVALEQLKEGDGSTPPFVVPNMPQGVWDDVTVLTPWALYRSYGDLDILRRQYPSMVAWLDQGVRRGPDRLWDLELLQLGDWLDRTAPPDEPGNARTNGTLVADAYLVHVTSVLAQISAILGEEAAAARYTTEFNQLKASFQAKYIAASGLLVGDTQTSLSLAIIFNLHATPEQASNAADRLAYLVRLAKFRVATGFAGTPIITHALTQSGNYQLAYRMLLEKNRPSWMYPITMGATTVWERWDSMLPDGSINPGEMTSFNHYALGSVINWLHECVAGIRPLQPGWKSFRVAPIPGGRIDSAEATYETPYGRVECRWSIRDSDNFELELLVPANSRALVIMPDERNDKYQAQGPESLGKWVGSGWHRFQSRWSNVAQWPPRPLVPPGMDSDDFVE
ncbi:bacterial alpha-L-rhamnosidase-domain-containing protein [Lipomyces tetrasporus]